MGFYVVSDDKCFYEGMTKEQILTAITQAIESHEIHDVDTGFVTTLKEGNANKALTFWVGTTAQYNAIAEKDQNCFYVLTDDTELEDLEAQIQRSMNVLKGEVIIDKSDDPIQFSGIMQLSIPLTGEHEIWDFTIVDVITSLNDHILCTVKPSFNAQTQEIDGANIMGSLPLSYALSLSQSVPSVVQYNIQINCFKSGDSVNIIRNLSNRCPIYDPDNEYPAIGIGIKKIVGVM